MDTMFATHTVSKRSDFARFLRTPLTHASHALNVANSSMDAHMQKDVDTFAKSGALELFGISIDPTFGRSSGSDSSAQVSVLQTLLARWPLLGVQSP